MPEKPAQRIQDVADMITAKDLAQSLSSLHVLISQMASKLDAMQISITTLTTRIEMQAIRVDSLVQDQADHESRIRMLERWRYALPTSIILAAGSVIVALISLFAKFNGF